MSLPDDLGSPRGPRHPTAALVAVGVVLVLPLVALLIWGATLF